MTNEIDKVIDSWSETNMPVFDSNDIENLKKFINAIAIPKSVVKAMIIEFLDDGKTEWTAYQRLRIEGLLNQLLYSTDDDGGKA